MLLLACIIPIGTFFGVVCTYCIKLNIMFVFYVVLLFSFMNYPSLTWCPSLTVVQCFALWLHYIRWQIHTACLPNLRTKVRQKCSRDHSKGPANLILWDKNECIQEVYPRETVCQSTLIYVIHQSSNQTQILATEYNLALTE